MKKLFFIFALLLLPVSLFAQLKVGIMDPQEVLEAMPETTGVQAELDSFVQQKQNEFQGRYSQWIEQVTVYTERAEAGELTEQQQQQEEERLAQLEQELEGLQQRIQNQIQQKQNELLNPLLIKIEDTMEDVAAELNLDYVINKTASTGDPIVYYSSSRGIDITNNVIQKLTNN